MLRGTMVSSISVFMIKCLEARRKSQERPTGVMLTALDSPWHVLFQSLKASSSMEVGLKKKLNVKC